MPPPPGGFAPPPGAYQQYSPGGMSGAGQLAEPAMRLLARIIDVVIVWVLSLIVLIPIGVGAGMTNSDIGIGAYLIGQVIAVVIVLAYEIVLVGQRGATVGKMLLGLKIVMRDGTPMDYNKAIKRHMPSIVGRGVYIIPIIGWLIGGLVLLGVAIANTAMVFQNKESLYDKVGNTMVITTK